MTTIPRSFWRLVAVSGVLLALACIPIHLKPVEPVQPWPQQPNPPAMDSGYPYWVEALITGAGALVTTVLVSLHRVRWHTKHANGNGAKK